MTMSTQARASGAGMWALVGALSASAAGAQTAPSAPAQPAQAAPPQGAAATPAGLQDEARAPGGISDVVVTARRRDESGQRVPVSITAISGAALSAGAVSTAKDLQQTAPSLNVNTGNSRDVDRYTIRGQGTTSGAAPGVVAYFAEVPLPTNGGGPGIYNDLESVQVLNGPQGTLFGVNTTGGAILFSPRKPSNNFGGYAEAAYGNYNNVQLQGALNVPIVNDKVLLRLAGDFRSRDGFTHDMLSGADYDNIHYVSARASLTLKPSESLESYFIFSYLNNHNRTTGYKLFAINPAATFISYYGQTRINQLVAQESSWTSRQTALSLTPDYLVKMVGVVNNTQWRLSSNVTLKNIASYYYYRNKAQYDQDGTPLVLADISIPTGRGSVSGSGSPAADNDYYTEELQLSWRSSDNLANFVAGGYLSGSSPRAPSIYVLGSTVATGPRYSLTTVAERANTRAAYAQGTLDLGALAPGLSGLKLTGGYRYTRDHKRDTAAGYRLSNPVDITSGTICTSVTGADYPNCFKQVEGTFSGGTYTFSADYRVSGALLLYATARSGFKSGGFNANVPLGDPRAAFGPEHVHDVEIGAKSDFHLGAVPVRFNIDAFHINYTAIQRSTPQVINGTSVTVTGNAADAHINGFDVQAIVQPVSALQLSGAYSYQDGSYYRSIAGAGGVANLTGDRLPYLPRHKFSGSASLTLDPMTVGAALSYSSTYTSSDLDYPGVALGGFVLFNANLLWRQPFGAPVDLRITANNLFDKVYRIAAPQNYQSLGVASAVYGEPRMVVASLRYSF